MSFPHYTQFDANNERTIMEPLGRLSETKN